MFSKFLSNLYGAIQILVNPSYLKNRVESINSSVIDLQTGIAIVGKSVFSELSKMQEKYPTDKGLDTKVEELKLYGIEDKEDLKELIFEKQNLQKLEEKYCSTCHRPYLLECVHKDVKKPDLK